MRKWMLAGMLVAAAAWGAGAAQNVLGRQSQNEGLDVVPRTRPVAVDGTLEGWDLGGQIWSFADIGVRNRYSVKTAAMWDADALYLAFVWRDPTPMFNTIDPAFNLNDGWKSDAVQLRLATHDSAAWVTMWYFTGKKQPVLVIDHWRNRRESRDGTDSDVHIAKEGGTDLGGGVKLAYKMDADGQGFVQTARIPWEKLYKAKPDVKAGLTFQMGLEFLWGDPTGYTWPIHRYADNMQPGKTSREFFWTAQTVWGDAKLVAKGPAEPRRYVSDEKRVEGHFKLRIAVPKSAAHFTVVIEDGQGNRVRNLGADLMPEDYEVAGGGGDMRQIEIGWDGLDDKGGLVAAGTYTARGLTRGGLGAEYEMSFYNPGTPPWLVSGGGGSWGADHSAPLRVARAGDGMVISWGFAEGGDGIIGLDDKGLKRWGEKRGALYLAADDAYVYGVPRGWHSSKDAVLRMNRKTAAYAPFVDAGVEQPIEFPLEKWVGEGYAIIGLAVSDTTLYVPLRKADDGSVWLLKADKNTARKIGELAPLPDTDVFCVGAGEALYAAKGNALYRGSEPVPLNGVGKITALATDLEGNILVMDSGADQQVKAFRLAGGDAVYTCGRKGGRPIRGKFDEEAMREVQSIAVDAKGEVWAVESWDFPRRVSVWNAKTGKLVKDYIGNTGYAGTGSWLHDSKSEYAHVGPIEIKLDKASRTWKVTQVYWVPDPDVPGEMFPVDPGSHVQTPRFTQVINGKPHEFLLTAPYRDDTGYALFMETPTGWRPVSAITTVQQIMGKKAKEGEEKMPDGEFAGYDPFDGVLWNDLNEDGRVQFSECEIIRGPQTGRSPRRWRETGIPLGSGWGARVGAGLVIYANGGARYKPARFLESGAPVYTYAAMERWGADDAGDWIPVDHENRVLRLSFKGYAGPTKIAGYDAATGATQWTYPNEFPGVHGSHRAPMPSPGRVIGPLKIMGVVDMGKDIGSVFAMRGNLGQDFFMTTDGLYVGAMFSDGRLPSDTPPAKESDLFGRPLEGFSHGSEAFNGWFGRQDDGQVRMTVSFLGREAASIVTVKGLESIKRFDAGTVGVTSDGLAAAEKDNLLRAERDAPAKVYTVKPRNPQNPWNAIPELVIDRAGYPCKATVKMIYDAEKLYLNYVVEDDTPWMNAGKDHTRLFKTGDCVDFQIKTTAGDAKNRDVSECRRVLVGQMDQKPVVILMVPKDPAADKALAHEYTSPILTKQFDRVEIAKDIGVNVKSERKQYVVHVEIPWARLNITPAPGLKLRADFGFIASDTAGSANAARIYWANKDTNLVSDLPSESWMEPQTFGEIVFE